MDIQVATLIASLSTEKLNRLSDECVSGIDQVAYFDSIACQAVRRRLEVGSKPTNQHIYSIY